MTDKQSRKIYVLCKLAGIPIPSFVDWHSRRPITQMVTKAEASKLITMLDNGERPSEDYINALGRGHPVSLCIASRF